MITKNSFWGTIYSSILSVSLPFKSQGIQLKGEASVTKDNKIQLFDAGSVNDITFFFKLKLRIFNVIKLKPFESNIGPDCEPNLGAYKHFWICLVDCGMMAISCAGGSFATH